MEVVVENALQDMAWEQVEVVEKLSSQVVEKVEKRNFLVLDYRTCLINCLRHALYLSTVDSVSGA